MKAVYSILAVVLFTVILAGLYVVYIFGSRYLRMAQTQSELQQQASQAMGRVIQEFVLSVDDPQAVRLQPASLEFLSAQGLKDADPRPTYHYDSGTGRLIWRTWVSFSLEGGQLSRAQVAVEGAPLHRPWGELVLPTLGDSAREVVAEDLERFSVLRCGSGLYSVCVVTALPGINGGPPCKSQLDTEVYLLNSP